MKLRNPLKMLDRWQVIWFFTVALWALSSNHVLYAQSGRTTLTGIVRDFEGASVPGADISLSLNGSGGEVLVSRTRSTDSGSFKFNKLAPGRYAVRVEHHLTGLKGGGTIQLGSKGSARMNITLGEGCTDNVDLSYKMTTADETTILSSALERTFRWLKIDSDVGSQVVVSNESVEAFLPEKVATYRLIQLDASSLKKRADVTGPFRFLTVRELRAKGDCAVASLDYSWETGKDAEVRGGSGIKLEYRRLQDKWIGKLLYDWVS
ncbi:MAG TPA: carboxypeptidase-like regulatory domain-containing protein [Pyrinomonadaceae bacterium]|nr:carboxypeptidase regulatory-like domain-containing protein [Acidobacteriota bacterium]HQU90848.1 carboxypeptidase-like regulatory domain-containing protein [Pyrinomonadaceae bacterium]